MALPFFSSAKNNLLYYASTVNCPGNDKPKSKGALYDLQGENVTSQYANYTGGNAGFCDGIEYRHANEGFFKFQTNADITCMFAVSYTNLQSTDIDLSTSNIMNVNIVRRIGDERVFSGLIHVRKPNAHIVINKFVIINNKLDDEQFNRGTDNKRIISRGCDSNGIFKIDATLNECYYDCGDDKIISTTNYELKTPNCKNNANEEDLKDIEQLNFGECKR